MCVCVLVCVCVCVCFIFAHTKQKESPDGNKENDPSKDSIFIHTDSASNKNISDLFFLRSD